jgi:class 3 adenylate cyclase/tetratricopeptide (TPR) repeat protein
MPPCPRCGEEAPSGVGFCPACGASLAPPLREVRKRVTVVFTDLAGSTALGERLDAESVREVMARYYDRARAVFERHGGTVEKFIGDAVMAVFGIPTLHEDDALRAVKAALELRDHLEELNTEIDDRWGLRLQARMSVNTGEVVAGHGEGRQAFATGDAVNVAARLEQAAAPDEILIGQETHEFVQALVRTEPVDPLTLKGKSEPVRAWRLLGGLDDAALEEPPLAPFLGREAELAELRGLLAAAAAGGTTRLVTVVAPPGVGKSRLTREFLAGVGERARVVVGRCPSYGEGTTYLPLAEIVAAAGASDLAGVRQLVGEGEGAELVVAGVASALGLGSEEVRTEEIFWAVRRLLEILARQRPLVVVVDDIHWGEPTFLDLLEYVSAFARAPILFLCLARPDLLDVRPAWGIPRANAGLLALEGLSEREAGMLVDRLLSGAALPDGVQNRILAAAEGNPLFVEQMLALAREDDEGADELVVPPTIQALLAARIDRLEPGERAVAAYASIEGRIFHRGAVSSMLPTAERDRLTTHLLALVRKEFIRPDASGFAGEDSFRFVHVLIRDAAYASMPKELRADLHERFAAWLERRSGEAEEVVGYHLEQAVRFRSELAPVDARTRALARRAGAYLGDAGRRASERGDVPAATNLLERAVALVESESPERLELLVALGGALGASGELSRAESLLGEAVERADDERLRSHALLERSFLRRFTHPEAGTEELLEAAEEAIRVFERARDEGGLSRAWRLVAEVHWTRCQIAPMVSALDHAERYARRAGEQHEIHLILDGFARACLVGPTPVDTAISRCLEIEAEGARRRTLQAAVTAMRAYLEAMRGDFPEARALAARSTAIFEELGEVIYLAAMQAWFGEIEMLAGDLAAAERIRRAGFDLLEAVGERGILSTVAAYLAETLCVAGDDEEALSLSEISERHAAADDATSQIVWRSARAKVLARRRDPGEAVRLAQAAVALARKTDCPNLQGDALVAFAEASLAAGAAETAEAATRDAIVLYDAKGNAVSAEAARARLTATAVPGDRAS